MVYIIKEDSSKFFLRGSVQFSNLGIRTRNLIYDRLRAGELLFMIPHWVGSDEHDRKVYKVGYLMDLLREVYPEMNMKECYSVVSDKYHLFLTVRRMSSLYNEYKERNFKNK